MKTKILIVIDSLHSGGAEKSLISLLSLIDTQQYDIELLMFSPEGLYIPLLSKEVEVLDVPDCMKELQQHWIYYIRQRKYRKLYVRIRMMSALRNPLNKKKFHSSQITWKWMSKEIKPFSKKYDIAIAYSQGQPTYFVAEKIEAKKKICWVNTDYKLAGYAPMHDRPFYQEYDHIVAVSAHNRDVFINEMPNFANKTTVIYDLISPTLISAMLQESGGYNDEYQGIRILTIGRLVDVKGYDLAIEASHLLKKAGIKCKWYVIGEGPLQSNIVQQIQKLGLEDRFILLGTHQNPYLFLKQSDIYVQPSRYEGFGLALAEARLLNIPVIATCFDSVHNQIVHQKNGLIVDMNATALYQGIVKLINNKKLRNKIITYLKQEKKGNMEEMKKIDQLLSQKGVI